MTPWLAAGIGVVLAAAMALHGPHTDLTYTPAKPIGPCTPLGCGASAPSQGTAGTGGTALSGTAGPRAQRKHGRRAASAASPAPHRGALDPVRQPLVVRYRTERSRPGGFTGLITLTGQALRSGWQLTFRYPGATVQSVAGLPWTVNGAEVTVTSPALPPGQAGPARIRIRASGTPSRPAGCTFNGVACSIH